MHHSAIQKFIESNHGKIDKGDIIGGFLPHAVEQGRIDGAKVSPHAGIGVGVPKHRQLSGA